MAISPDLERLARAAYAEGRRSLELIYAEMDERGKDQWRNIVRAVLDELRKPSEARTARRYTSHTKTGDVG